LPRRRREIIRLLLPLMPASAAAPLIRHDVIAAAFDMPPYDCQLTPYAPLFAMIFYAAISPYASRHAAAATLTPLFSFAIRWLPSPLFAEKAMPLFLLRLRRAIAELIRFSAADIYIIALLDAAAAHIFAATP